jgi:hypothetical protein
VAGVGLAAVAGLAVLGGVASSQSGGAATWRASIARPTATGAQAAKAFFDFEDQVRLLR